MDFYQPPMIEHVQVIALSSPSHKGTEEVQSEVRAAYGSVAKAGTQKKCQGNSRSCCGISAERDDDYSQQLGYSQEELDSVPEGANMGLGCGNPQAIAALQPGEVVLDLGAGGGFDAFLAASRVGQAGKVMASI